MNQDTMDRTNKYTKSKILLPLINGIDYWRNLRMLYRLVHAYFFCIFFFFFGFTMIMSPYVNLDFFKIIFLLFSSRNFNNLNGYSFLNVLKFKLIRQISFAQCLRYQQSIYRKYIVLIGLQPYKHQDITLLVQGKLYKKSITNDSR